MAVSIKNNVLALRERTKVTQEGLAKAVGVTRQSIISIERENCIPSVFLALKIARYFKVSVEEVFELV